jgi:hypothetical protein
MSGSGVDALANDVVDFGTLRRVEMFALELARILYTLPGPTSGHFANSRARSSRKSPRRAGSIGAAACITASIS